VWKSIWLRAKTIVSDAVPATPAAAAREKYREYFPKPSRKAHPTAVPMQENCSATCREAFRHPVDDEMMIAWPRWQKANYGQPKRTSKRESRSDGRSARVAQFLIPVEEENRT